MVDSTLIGVHVGLFCVNGLAVGFGSVVGKIGLADTSPFAFALYRQLIATPVLLAASAAWERQKWSEVRSGDAKRLVAAGFLLFVSNVCYTVATKISNPVVGATWQVSAPIFTTAGSILVGWEKISTFKILGIVFAFAGAAFTVAFGQSKVLGQGSSVAGNVLFMVNVSSYAAYALITRSVNAKHPPLAVTGATFAVDCVFLFLAALAVQYSTLIVPDKWRSNAWNVPSTAVFALVYFVVVYSVVGYSMLNFAHKHVRASTVMAYNPVQPLASAFGTFALVNGCGRTNTTMCEHVRDADLSEPGWNALGGIGIVLGLCFIIQADINSAPEQASFICENEEKCDDERLLDSF